MDNNVMKLLLIEDDKKEWEAFKKVTKFKHNIEFIGITDSDIEGLELVKQKQPDGIILDLELNKGSGNSNGFIFLEKLKKLNLNNLPKIVVTTNVCSDTVYEYLHENGVDLIFYKKQENYSYENVINTLDLLKGYNKKQKDSKLMIPKEDEIYDLISNKINEELDLIGVSSHLKGRKILYDAIYYVIESEKDTETTVSQYLVKLYKKSSSTINRAMQNAILHAWRVSPIEDLTKYYTAKVNYETGVPTPMEFVYYYAEKIKKEI